MGAHIDIQIINESTAVTDAQVAQVVEALQLQCDQDYTPNYGIYVKLTIAAKGAPLPPHFWQLIFLDNSDQAGALGYHEVTKNNTPIGFAFVQDAIQAGMSWSVTASHELLEMLGDPGISCVKEQDNADGSMTFHFKEICDPCEDDSYGYNKTLSDGTTILVSDFVLPRYWDAISTEKVFDFQGKITKPFQVLPGGYISVLEVPKSIQWQQITEEKASARKNVKPFNRRARHAIPKHQWRRSER